MQATLACRIGGDDGAPFVTVGQITVGTDLPVEGDTYAVPLVIDTQALSNDVVCALSSTGPNPGQSPEISWMVALPAPTLALVDPADGSISPLNLSLASRSLLDLAILV